MATHRLPMSLQEYEQLEVYYFKLIMYTQEGEFRHLSTLKQKGVTDEISYISIVLGVLARIFGDHTRNRRPVMAWPVEVDDPTEAIAYRFTSAKVASLALNCNKSKVTAVCKGHEERHLGNKEMSENHRNSTGGWRFCYEKYYEDNVVEYDFETGTFK